MPEALTVTRTTMADIEASPELDALLAEYAAESANNEIGPVSPQFPAYRAMEASGLFHAFAAHREGKLVGFLFLLTPILPHFGKLVGVVESYFVAAAYRKTGAGTQLRVAAEDAARAAGAVGLLLSAPTGGRLDQVLPHVGYRETNRTFFKGLV